MTPYMTLDANAFRQLDASFKMGVVVRANERRETAVMNVDNTIVPFLPKDTWSTAYIAMSDPGTPKRLMMM